MDVQGPRSSNDRSFPGAETIEQWYKDYFERDDPAGLAPEALRRMNLFNAMTNKGFSQIRAWTIVNWLMRSQGILRDFDDRTRRNSRRAKRARLDKSTAFSVEPRDSTVIPQEKTDQSAQTSTPKKTTTADFDGTNEDDDSDSLFEHCDDEPTEEEIRLLCGMNSIPVTPEKSPQKGDQTSRSSSKRRCESPSSPPINESEYIRALQHRLRFFDIIYGDQLPPDDPDLEFDYTKGPFPRAIRKRKTQTEVRKRCTCLNTQIQIKPSNNKAEIKGNNKSVQVQIKSETEPVIQVIKSKTVHKYTLAKVTSTIPITVPHPPFPARTCTCHIPTQHSSTTTHGITLPEASQTMTPAEKDLDTINRHRVTKRTQEAETKKKFQEIEDQFELLYGKGDEKRFSCGEKLKWMEILEEREKRVGDAEENASETESEIDVENEKEGEGLGVYHNDDGHVEDRDADVDVNKEKDKDKNLGDEEESHQQQFEEFMGFD